jgi:RNA polymerase sigma factor (sigma-70 family)
VKACSNSFASRCFDTSCEKRGIPDRRKTSHKKPSCDSFGTSAKTACSITPKAWLFAVANNLAVEASRNESHSKELDATTRKQIEESRSGLQADPEKLMLQRERLDRLHIAVLNLTPLQRECLHLRAEGHRYREIAGLLELSPSTVMDAVRRATLKLAREFDGEVSA